jgi:hypothetical protein
MVCQYPRAGPVSSEKHEVMPGTEVQGQGGHASMGETGTVMMGGYRARDEWLAVNSRLAKLRKS